jgi:ABC-2 type transport system permease protein
MFFSAQIPIYHPIVAIIGLVGVVIGTGSIALALTALICRSGSARAVQNAMSGPLFLLAGVLVPVSLLSPWLALAGKCLYLTWAVDLLRDSFVQNEPADVGYRILMMLLTGLLWALGGSILLQQMLNRLRRNGAV